MAPLTVRVHAVVSVLVGITSLIGPTQSAISLLSKVELGSVHVMLATALVNVFYVCIGVWSIMNGIGLYAHRAWASRSIWVFALVLGLVGIVGVTAAFERSTSLSGGVITVGLGVCWLISFAPRRKHGRWQFPTAS